MSGRPICEAPPSAVSKSPPPQSHVALDGLIYLSQSSPCQGAFFTYNTGSFMAESSDTMDMKEFQLHEKDTGSADVQVALLTRRISQLTEHLKSHAKDHSSRRGLLKMVAMRRSLLDYLSKSESDRYKSLLEKLHLRK